MAKKMHSTRQTNLHPPEFRPLCAEQRRAYEICENSTVTFLTGPAGCTKSFTAMAFAIDQLLSDNISRICLTRPAVEACGEELGYMPGDAKQKMGPYIHPLSVIIEEYASDHKDTIRAKVDVVPLAFMRGRTLRNCVAILDEAQNCNEKQLEMFLTRIGPGSKMIVCGDPNQADIRNSPLVSIASDMLCVQGVSHYAFTKRASISRHPIIPPIIDVFEGRKR